ncbi:hypothetical protein SRM_02146 [Salinibacter ruber M8]|uniref:Uncharacterized protein n=1 Tax=Salinibacter ruber (strain M8) TaxID=761659 RepID=D5HAL2_SALRM|nr:hypothetical protein SRM_02146 [Salinibacter ruber M8]
MGGGAGRDRDWRPVALGGGRGRRSRSPRARLIRGGLRAEGCVGRAMGAIRTCTDAQRRASSPFRPCPPRRPALLGGPLGGVHHLRPRNEPRDHDAGRCRRREPFSQLVVRLETPSPTVTTPINGIACHITWKLRCGGRENANRSADRYK